MRTTTLIEQTTTKVKTTSATCDFCGKEFSSDDVKNDWFNTIKIETTFGSRHEGFYFTGEICDDCIDRHLASKLRKEEEAYL